MNGETLHKELLEAIDYNNIDDYREFFKSSQNPEISNKVNNPSPENIKMINNFIKSSSNSNGKTVPVYFLLEDETGEFLSSEYKMDFTFDDSLKSTVDETIKNSIAEQDKVILDTRKFFLQQYEKKMNNIYLYDVLSDNSIDFSINPNIDLNKSLTTTTRSTGLVTSLLTLTKLPYLETYDINGEDKMKPYPGEINADEWYDKIAKGGYLMPLPQYLNLNSNSTLNDLLGTNHIINYFSNTYFKKDKETFKIKFKRTFKINFTDHFNSILEKLNTEF